MYNACPSVVFAEILTDFRSGGWMRGSKADFEEWASLANDSRWSYEGLLCYFKSTESFWNDGTNPSQHGYDGPLKVEVPSTTGRVYPLRDAVFNSYEAVGIEALPGLDANTGDNLGFGEIAENRRNGKRQIASEYYPLDGITVLTESLVGKILLENVETPDEGSSGNKVTATGVRLVNGTEFRGKEIIVSAGSYRTPQLLMLSGIGPAEVLSEYDIEQKLDAPEVGQGLADHLFFTTEWKLAPEYRMDTVDSGNPLFAEAQYGLGQPNNFVASYGVSDIPGLTQAISSDEGQTPEPDTHWLLKETRTFFEAFVLYANLDPTLPSNNSYLTVANVGLLPTSRGSVSINSTDPTVPPVINPNFFASEVDRFVWRDGLRKMIKMMVGGQSSLGQGIVVGEAPPAGLPALTVDSTDDEIEARIRATAM
jgi:choline dehydrogenase-like flavoprotein